MKKRRKDLGLTQPEVVRRMSGDLTTATYSNWENGLRKVSTKFLMQVADALEVSMDYLLGLDGAAEPEDRMAQLLSLQGDTPEGEKLRLLSDRSLCFSHRILKEFNLKEEHCMLVVATDASMSPLIQENDRVLIDLTRQVPEENDVFALLVKNRIWFRRIRPELDGSFTVIAEDSRATPETHIEAHNLHTLNILGRAAWIGRFR
jgi:transcriptional regulator with XRE-family HTH domain